MGRIKNSEILYSFLPRKCSTLWWLCYWRIKENKATLKRRIGSFTTALTKYLHTFIVNTNLGRMEISPFFLTEALTVILGHMGLHLWRKEFELRVIILQSCFWFCVVNIAVVLTYMYKASCAQEGWGNYTWPPDKLLLVSANVIFTNRVRDWGPVWCLAYKRQLVTSY